MSNLAISFVWATKSYRMILACELTLQIWSAWRYILENYIGAQLLIFVREIYIFLVCLSVSLFVCYCFAINLICDDNTSVRGNGWLWNWPLNEWILLLSGVRANNLICLSSHLKELAKVIWLWDELTKGKEDEFSAHTQEWKSAAQSQVAAGSGARQLIRCGRRQVCA